MGRRALKNAALDLLAASDPQAGAQKAMRQFETADNMTDSMAALRVLSHIDCEERLEALSVFEERWEHDSLVMDKWLSVQALSSLPDALTEVEALLAHDSFDLRKPNKVRALVGAFCHSNLLRFHQVIPLGSQVLGLSVQKTFPAEGGIVIGVGQ